MKIIIHNKNIIISLIILISLILTLYLNFTSFIIDNNFNSLLFFLSIIICLISFFLFSIKIETSDRVNFIITIISFLVSILFSYIIIELLNQNVLFNLPIKRLILNFIAIIFLHLFIYSICNRINLTIIVTNLLIFILGIVNYVVVCFRGTPFVPWDIFSLKTATYVASNYTFQFSHYLLLAITLFAFIISIALKANYKFKNKKVTTILRFCFILIIAFSTIAFYCTHIINYFDLETNLWQPKTEYANNGFLASFIKQSKNLFVKTPDNYKVETVKNIMSETNNNQTVQTNNDTPNIIVIMNESFSDLSVNGNFKTNEDYMPYFRSLTENTIKGNTYVSILGGATPNSEWEFLTNNSMAFMPHNTVPYQQYIKTPSSSLASLLKEQGYTPKALHTLYAAGYRRNAVYPLLGFDSFDTLESLSNIEYIRNYASDKNTYEHIIEQFKTKSDNEKIFNFTVTIQNHSGYDVEDYNSTIHLTDIENCPKVEQFLSLMKESDDALKYLINYFKNYNEKTIILLFGDHQPGHIEDEFLQTIMEDYTNQTSRYITPFMLWANYDIEEKYIDKISLNYLSNIVVRVKRENGDIDNVFLEEYVVGVVAGEMPASFDEEALKAQCVASRSYVLRKLEHNKENDYDVVDTVSNQVYLDEEELQKKWGSNYTLYINKIRSAVNETSMEYLEYDGKVIEAMFFSTSNGYTEDSGVFFSTSLPYLKSVESSYDEIVAKAFNSTTSMSLQEFYERLGLSYCDELVVEVMERSISNRIIKLKINGVEFFGKDVYNKLGLRSCDFEFIQIGNNIEIKTTNRKNII